MQTEGRNNRESVPPLSRESCSDSEGPPRLTTAEKGKRTAAAVSGDEEMMDIHEMFGQSTTPVVRDGVDPLIFWELSLFSDRSHT